MDQEVKVGIIGDYDPHLRSHIDTVEALGHAATTLSIPLRCSWIPTQLLAEGIIQKIMEPFHGLRPGSPYKSMDGALKAIQFAREQGRPFMGA